MKKRTLAELKGLYVEAREKVADMLKKNPNLSVYRDNDYFRTMFQKIKAKIDVQRIEGRVLRMVIIVNILAIISIFLCGCLEHTMKGAGRMIQGTGSLVSGIGTDVYQAADGYGKQ